MSTSERIRLSRRIHMLSKVCRDSNNSAATLVGTVLALWCSNDFPALPPPSLPFSARLAQDDMVKAFVETLRRLEFLEATYWLSSLYATTGDKDHRKKLAMFFTPPSITKGLLDDLKEQGADFGKQTFFDPACGGAAFLAPVAIRMRDSLLAVGHPRKAVLEHLEGHLRGRDIDATLCELSKHFLLMAVHGDIQETGYSPTFDVSCSDSLSDSQLSFANVDVVVCNPPYRKMDASEVRIHRPAYADVVESQPNLYGLFIYLCIRLLREGGYAALVTPTSFFSGQSFRSLRKFLVDNVDIAHIGMVSDRKGVFIDVEQETALTVVRKRTSRSRNLSKTRVSVVSSEGDYVNVGRCQIPGGGGVWPIPRSVEDLVLLQVVGASPFRLSDYGYRVRLGFFVWNRDKRPKYETADAVRRAGSETAMPLLWSSDIASGEIIKFDPEIAVSGQSRFVDLSDRHHTAVISRPAVLLQRVTSNTQSRRLIACSVPIEFIRHHGGFIAENHVVVLERTSRRSVFDASTMAKLIGCQPVDRYYRCISGATNVSSFELAQLPLPDPEALKIELGRGAHMDQAARRAFGLDKTVFDSRSLSHAEQKSD